MIFVFFLRFRVSLVFEPLLRPFVHNLPLDHRFKNLFAKVAWAQTHNLEMRKIVAPANAMAQWMCMWEGRRLYWAILLVKYQNLALEDPESVKAPEKLCQGRPIIARDLSLPRDMPKCGSEEVEKVKQPKCSFFCSGGRIESAKWQWLEAKSLDGVKRVGPPVGGVNEKEGGNWIFIWGREKGVQDERQKHVWWVRCEDVKRNSRCKALMNFVDEGLFGRNARKMKGGYNVELSFIVYYNFKWLMCHVVAATMVAVHNPTCVGLSSTRHRHESRHNSTQRVMNNALAYVGTNTLYTCLGYNIKRYHLNFFLHEPCDCSKL